MNDGLQSDNAELQLILDEVHRRCIDNRDGALADYIPELAKVPPEGFGIAIATARGQLFTIGDTDMPFTIQSVSKAFTFCLAIELIGRERSAGAGRRRAERRCLQRDRVRSPYAAPVQSDGQRRRDHGRRDHPRRQRRGRFRLRPRALLGVPPGDRSLSTSRSIARRPQPAIATARSRICC